jgi:putative endonuclease
MTLTTGGRKGHYMEKWFAYILECSDGSYYVGITNSPAERLKEHNSGKGSSWTEKRRPVVFRYIEACGSKSAARKREIELKGWRREKKERLFISALNLLPR